MRGKRVLQVTGIVVGVLVVIGAGIYYAIVRAIDLLDGTRDRTRPFSRPRQHG